MIKEGTQKELINELVDEILNIEKQSLSKLNQPAKSKVVDDIYKKFEEVMSKYENK